MGMVSDTRKVWAGTTGSHSVYYALIGSLSVHVLVLPSRPSWYRYRCSAWLRWRWHVRAFRTHIWRYFPFKRERVSANIILILHKALITGLMTYTCHHMQICEWYPSLLIAAPVKQASPQHLIVLKVQTRSRIACSIKTTVCLRLQYTLFIMDKWGGGCCRLSQMSATTEWGGILGSTTWDSGKYTQWTYRHIVVIRNLFFGILVPL